MFTLLLVGGLYLAINLDGMVWRILFSYLSTAFAVRALDRMAQRAAAFRQFPAARAT